MGDAIQAETRQTFAQMFGSSNIKALREKSIKMYYSIMLLLDVFFMEKKDAHWCAL